MKKASILIPLSLFFVLCSAQLPDFAWARGGGGNFGDVVVGMVIGASGDVYVAGNFYSDSIQIGNDVFYNHDNSQSGYNNGPDIFMVKYNKEGKILWAKTFGDRSGDYLSSIAIDEQENIYMTGTFWGKLIFNSDTLERISGMTFLVKFDKYGDPVWAKNEGNLSFSNARVAIDRQGDICVAGTFKADTAYFANTKLVNEHDSVISGRGCLFLAKYNGHGSGLWAKKVSGYGNFELNGMAVDTSGHIYVGGNFINYMTIGDSVLVNTGIGGDIYFSRFDRDGNMIWIKHCMGKNAVDLRTIVLDNDGHIYAAGYFSTDTIRLGDTTLINSLPKECSFVVQYEQTGKFGWAKAEVSSSGDIYAEAIAVGDNNSIYLAGNFADTLMIGNQIVDTADIRDIFIMHYDNKGNVLGVKTAGGLYYDDVRAISYSGNGVYISGAFASKTILFGSDTLYNALKRSSDFATYDFYVAAMSSMVGITAVHTRKDILLYPNPTTAQLHVSTGDGSIRTYQVFNALGGFMGSGIVRAPTFSIDISTLAAGLYFLKVTGSNSETVMRFIKQ